jgi:hypothetical protein
MLSRIGNSVFVVNKIDSEFNNKSYLGYQLNVKRRWER